jgi:hypothetical protein
MLNVDKYSDLVSPELLVALPAGGVFGAAYTGIKAVGADEENAPTKKDLVSEVAANSLATGAATGTGLLLNKYLN